MSTIESPIFGMTRTATEAEISAIMRQVKETPVAVFQALNVLLNGRGFFITIDANSEEDA